MKSSLQILLGGRPGDLAWPRPTAGLVPVRMAAPGRPTRTVYRHPELAGRVRAVPAASCASQLVEEGLRVLADFMLGADLLALVDFFLRL